MDNYFCIVASFRFRSGSLWWEEELGERKGMEWVIDLIRNYLILTLYIFI